MNEETKKEVNKEEMKVVLEPIEKWKMDGEWNSFSLHVSVPKIEHKIIHSIATM